MVISRDFCWGVITFFGGKFENHRFCAYRVGSEKTKKKNVPIFYHGPELDRILSKTILCFGTDGNICIYIYAALQGGLVLWLSLIHI